jgi:hypothetical protein
MRKAPTQTSMNAPDPFACPSDQDTAESASRLGTPVGLDGVRKRSHHCALVRGSDHDRIGPFP